MFVLNLTQHLASPEQVEAGVQNVPSFDREALRALLTFTELPTRQEVEWRARDLALFAHNWVRASGDEPDSGYKVMIGGAPFLMEPLVNALRRWEFAPVFAFSKRESVDVVQEDGSVRKTAVFRHLGFVEA